MEKYNLPLNQNMWWKLKRHLPIKKKKKSCSTFQATYTRVTGVLRATRTHKAQEIKAVNKGPSDKGSPDSYESRAGRRPATGSFRTRADERHQANYRDEQEGHHLHFLLPIHTDFHIFTSVRVAIIHLFHFFKCIISPSPILFFTFFRRLLMEN